MTTEELPVLLQRRPSSLPYVIAVIMMTLCGVIAILVLTALRPNTDNTALITIIIGFLAPTTLNLMTLLKAHETQSTVNGTLTSFLANAKQIGHLQGKEAGRQEATAAAAALLVAAASARETLGLAAATAKDAVSLAAQTAKEDLKAKNPG